jgi:hypothetical protein
MKVAVLVKATKDSEAGVPPSAELLTEMGRFNESLVKAGILLAGEGLKPSRQGKRVRFHGNQRAGCRILALAGPFDRGSCRVGETLPESDAHGF